LGNESGAEQYLPSSSFDSLVRIMIEWLSQEEIKRIKRKFLVQWISWGDCLLARFGEKSKQQKEAESIEFLPFAGTTSTSMPETKEMLSLAISDFVR
jgi:hypothetical protein